MRILMVSDVYFPRVNGVSTSIESFRRALLAEGIEVRLVVPRYGDEPEEAGIIRVAGRPVPGDAEDRLVSWRAMHAATLAAAVRERGRAARWPATHAVSLRIVERVLIPAKGLRASLFVAAAQVVPTTAPATMRVQRRTMSAPQVSPVMVRG